MQARYDLAVDAIKTFHTGVSEDFLLKEGRFKELRDRLLGSASDFYNKLGGLLGGETDVASRRALAPANFELAGLTAMVGRNADAIAAHRSVLAALGAGRRAGGRRIRPGRRRPEPDRGRRAPRDVGQDRRGAGRLPRGRVGPAAAPAADTPEARAALASCRSRMGFFLTTIGKDDRRWPPTDWRGPSRMRWPRPPAHRRRLVATWETRSTGSAGCWRTQAGPRRRKPSTALPWRSAGLAEEQPRRRRAPQQSGGHPQQPRNPALEERPVEGGGGRIPHRPGDPAKLAEDNPAVTEFRKQLQASHFNLGNLLRQTGRRKEAEDLFRAALEIERGLVAENPAVPEFRRLLALNHHYLGMVLKDTGRVREAEPEYLTAESILRKLVAANPAVTTYRSDLGSLYSDLGVLLAESGRTREAEIAFRAGIASVRTLAESNPTVTEFRDRLATAHVNLGELLTESGRPSEAEPEYHSAQSIFRVLAEANPAVTYYRFGLAYTLIRRGLLLSESGRPSEAESEDRAAAAIYRGLAEASPKVPDYADGLATALTNLGDALRPTGRSAEARDAYDRAIAVGEPLVSGHSKVPDVPGQPGGLVASSRLGSPRPGRSRRRLVRRPPGAGAVRGAGIAFARAMVRDRVLPRRALRPGRDRRLGDLGRSAMRRRPTRRWTCCTRPRPWDSATPTRSAPRPRSTRFATVPTSGS